MKLDASERREIITKKFSEFFAGTPPLWSRAPGRVDLMGSHTDYNLGFVMTMTIDRDTWIAARKREDKVVRLRSLNLPGEAIFSLEDIQHASRRDWTEYVRGVAWALQQDGHALQGWDGLIHSTIPIGSGLSSSAALEMAAAITFVQTGCLDLGPVLMARLGQKAENQFVGMNCGILDQYSSAMGQPGSALLLDCRSLTSSIAPIAADLQVVICNTKAERNLVGTEYGDRRAQCERGVEILKRFYPEIEALRDVSLAQLQAHAEALPEVVYRRSQFVIEENQRVLDLGEALTAGDRSRLRGLCEASYQGARDLYEIASPTMEAMQRAMLGAPGVVAARQAGAGFGGCMVALVQAGEENRFAEAVVKAYHQKTGITPEIYPVQAVPGAGPLE